jgi:Protein of unknown function (DUF1588)/Protein of unknown function (DUF1585)
VWSDKSDYRDLLLAESIPINESIANFYGGKANSGMAFENQKLNAGHRAGVLTHPYLLATFAYTETISPIHRGVFVSRSLLGRVLRAPPIAVAPAAAALSPELSTRQRVAQQTSDVSCMSCHGLINPLGFTLENFDAVGRFRAQEQGKPIDATGSYLTRSGEEKNFHGVRELAKFLAESPESQTAFVEQFFHYMIKQPVRAYAPEASQELTAKFQKQSFHIRNLAAEIVGFSAFLPEKPVAVQK